MSITIKDVAKRAKVSPSTVSRVINNSSEVKSKTKSNVLKAIEELGYQPSEIAQGLRSKRTKTISLIVPDIKNPFFADLAKEVENISREKGFSLILCNNNEDPQREKEYLKLMMNKRVDGLILVPLNHNLDVLKQVKDSGIPMVFVDRYIPEFNNDYVQLNNVDGSMKLTNYLIESGHKEIGFIGGSLNLSVGRARLEGYKSALEESEISFKKELIGIGEFNYETGYKRTKEILQLPNPPTAIVSGNNEISLGVLNAINDLNLIIPKDVMLATFDDPEWAKYILKSIVVLRQPVEVIASLSVNKVLEVNTIPNLKSLVEGELIIRNHNNLLDGKDEGFEVTK